MGLRCVVDSKIVMTCRVALPSDQQRVERSKKSKVLGHDIDNFLAGGRSSGIPASGRNVGFFLRAMRYEGLCDVEGFNEHFPGCVVYAEDSLVFLDVVFPLFGDFMRSCRHWFLVSVVLAVF
jgi:hypothetical protein